MAQPNGATAVDLMDTIIEQTRAMGEAFTAWDNGDRAAASTALGRCRELEKLHKRFYDRLTGDVQAYDRKHDDHDPRD